MLKSEPCRETVAPPLTGRAAPGPAPLRILCADDDAMARQLVQIVLVRGGHAVTCVNDGMEAWLEIAARPDGYDLLVTDHDMPRLDGLALVSQLRGAGWPARIVVVSGSIDRTLETRYREIGVDAIVAKPFSIRELQATVQALRPYQVSRLETPLPAAS